MKLFYLSGGWEGDRATFWCRGKGNAASFSWPPGFLASVSLLTEGVCLPTQAGKCWHTLPSLLIGSSNEEKCLGAGGGSPPQYSKFSGKSSSQALPVTKYLRGYFAQGTKMPWWYLVKSLQNCLITVLNVRHLCNLNVRYKFEFLSFFYFY